MGMGLMWLHYNEIQNLYDRYFMVLHSNAGPICILRNPNFACHYAGRYHNNRHFLEWILNVQVPGAWWRHQMETFSALLAICAGNSPVPGEFPAQRPVKRSFGVFFDLRLNKRLSKQSWGCWFETPPGSLWRHCIEFCVRIAWLLPWVVKQDVYQCHVQCTLLVKWW